MGDPNESDEEFLNLSDSETPYDLIDTKNLILVLCIIHSKGLSKFYIINEHLSNATVLTLYHADCLLVVLCQLPMFRGSTSLEVWGRDRTMARQSCDSSQYTPQPCGSVLRNQLRTWMISTKKVQPRCRQVWLWSYKLEANHMIVDRQSVCIRKCQSKS